MCLPVWHEKARVNSLQFSTVKLSAFNGGLFRFGYVKQI